MSAATTTTRLTKKQKKALAFRENKGKGKGKTKTKSISSFDELDNDVPVEEDQDLAEMAVGEAGIPLEAPAGRAARAPAAGAKGADALGGGHKARKRKHEEAEGADGVGIEEEDVEPKPKARKKRKGVDGAGVDAEGAEKDEDEVDIEAKSRQRFILFVGNLKYSTTKEAVEQHFSKCDPPPTVRLMKPKPSATSKPTAKSKGFAFVEFTHRNALQQGLKLHQSELEGRQINVELTAGGGGKSEQRLEKVKRRNKELHEQRRKQLVKRTPSKEKGGEGEGVADVQMERPQRYSATSGVDQVPLKNRTWSIPEAGDEGGSGKKRGSKKSKKRPSKSLGTGVNAIPVG